MWDLEPHAAVWDLLEEEARWLGEVGIGPAVQLSIAISLKRLADAVTCGRIDVEDR